jgi:hypothetical protein
MKSIAIFILICLPSSSWAKWYSQICVTGAIESVMRDQDGDIVFVRYPNETDEEYDDNGIVSQNYTDRQLRHDAHPVPTIRTSKRRRYLQEPISNNTAIFHVRSCACQAFPQDADLLLCPADADFCGMSFTDEPVACYSVSVTEVVARNAWPLILLWYFGLVIICFCTIQGETTKYYVKSWFTSKYNEDFIDRIFAEDDTTPSNQSSWWTWQRYRFEQNLMAQAQWRWRNQESQQQETHRVQVLLPQLEMKTKIFTNNDFEGGLHRRKEKEEDDGSFQQPTCTICFVPFEEGDRIGALECQHNFHSKCLKTWLCRRNACPLCSLPVAKRRQQQSHG